MKRVLAACMITVAVTLLAGCTHSSTPPDNGEHDAATPNFVFVLTDDLSLNLVSHMPHVVAMQRAGTTMSNYYVVDSLCCPSRSAIFTGQYPHDDGVFTNAGKDGGYPAFQQNHDEQRTFAVTLAKHGYQSAMMGKYLNLYKPKNPVPPGWSSWDVAGKGGYNELQYGMNVDGKTVNYGAAQKDYLTDVLSEKADDFISAATKPFMLEVATYAPHEPYTPAAKYANAAKNVALPKTPAYDTLPTDAPPWLASQHRLTKADETKILKNYRQRVEADLSVDDLIGRIEQTLAAKGVADNTYLIFSSDNGYHMGEYRLLAGKQTAFDTDIHVPMVVVGPHVPAGRSVSQLTSSIDLAPTFESLAGAGAPSTVDGVSMADLWHGRTPAHWQQAVLVEHHYAGPGDAEDPDAQTSTHADPPTYTAVRTSDALYVKYADGNQEYYDTSKDPYELHNLAKSGVPSSMSRALGALVHCHSATACQSAAGAG